MTQGWMIELFHNTFYFTHFRNGKFVREGKVYDPTCLGSKFKRIRDFARQAQQDGAPVELSVMGWAIRWGVLPK